MALWKHKTVQRKKFVFEKEITHYLFYFMLSFFLFLFFGKQKHEEHYWLIDLKPFKQMVFSNSGPFVLSSSVGGLIPRPAEETHDVGEVSLRQCGFPAPSPPASSSPLHRGRPRRSGPAAGRAAALSPLRAGLVQGLRWKEGFCCLENVWKPLP